MGTVNQIAGQNQSALERVALVQHLTAGVTLTPAVGDPAAPLITGALNFGYDGAGYEAIRNNINGGTVLASAVRSATITSAALTNTNWRGATFYVNITAVPASGSATVAVVVQGQDPVGLGWFELGRSGQFSASFAATFYPGVTSGTQTVPIVLPRDVRILGAVSAGATSKDVTFSIGVEWIL